MSLHFKGDIIPIKGLYYRGITNNSPILAGVEEGTQVILTREPNNLKDSNAVKVYILSSSDSSYFLGYIPKELAKRLSPILDRGSNYESFIHKISRLKKGPRISIILKTYPISTGHRLPTTSQNVTRDYSNFDSQSPTLKKFRQHTDLIRWSRNFDKISGIYSIWSRSYKMYIGQAIDVGSRWREHFRQLNNMVHHNRNLQQDWVDMGEKYFRFDLLEEVEDSMLDKLERFYIEKLNSWRKGYNATSDGQYTAFNSHDVPEISQADSDISYICMTPTGKAFNRHPDLHRWITKHNGIAGVYIIWSACRKVYINFSTDIGRRWANELNALNDDGHPNAVLQSDWIQMGASYFRFDVLEIGNKPILKDLKKYYLLKFEGSFELYNDLEFR